MRGYAHLQAGRPREAAEEFDRSLEAAHSSEALYEVALSLRARARLDDSAEDAAGARSILDSLKVVAVPEVPL